MWNRLALCVVLAACGFRSPAANQDGSGSDASGGGGSDAAIDGAGGGSGDGSSGATDCWPHWMDGSVRISAATVAPIMELSSTGDDRNPWISDDDLLLYFSRDTGPPGNGDIDFASRGSATGMFGAPSPFASMNSNGREARIWLTPDQLALVISSERSTVGHLEIHMATRNQGDRFGPPDRTHLTMVNAMGTQRFDPFLSSDLLRLYLSADTGPGGKLQLWVATRRTTGDDFGAPSLVPGIDSSSNNNADPTLYQDELVLLFSSFPNNGTADLWYATRSSVTAAFGTPMKIPTIDTSFDELDPVLSHDGCELYFSSSRNTIGRRQLFRAQIMK